MIEEGQQQFIENSNQPETEKAELLGKKFKRITVLGTFQEIKDPEKDALVDFGKTLSREGVTTLIGGRYGYPNAVAQGAIERECEDRLDDIRPGTILVGELAGRVAQGKIVEHVKGRLRKIKLDDWENMKDFLFHESVDALIFMSPSKTLGTITEAFESIDRMTYWGTVDEPKLIPIIFIGKEWEEPTISIFGAEARVSRRQVLEGFLQSEAEAFKQRAVDLDKSQYIRFVSTPQEAIDTLRNWSKSR